MCFPSDYAHGYSTSGLLVFSINTSTALLMTLLQHLIVKGIVEAIGNFSSIYVTIIITGTVGILNYVVFLKWRE
jgi:hypothetical protein